MAAPGDPCSQVVVVMGTGRNMSECYLPGFNFNNSNMTTAEDNTMSDYHMKWFVQMSQSDAIRYNKEMATYNELKKEKDAEEKAEKKEEGQKTVAEIKEEKKKLQQYTFISAYIFYVNELREKLKIEQPALSVMEVAKEAGRRWEELSSSAKVKYEKLR